MQLTLSVLKDTLSIIRLPHTAAIPEWLSFESSPFLSVTKTTDELSIVCAQPIVPIHTENCVRDWRAFKVEGPLDFSLTGILASLLQPLAEHQISIFAVSSYDTDYILVKEENLSAAIELLKMNCNVLC